MACQTVIGKSTPAGDIVGTTDSQTLTNKTIALGSNTITGNNWQVFYTNGTGDIVQLPLGSSGTYLGSNGTSSAPSWSTPTGAGDVSKVGTPSNNQIGVWTGNGTIEGDSNFQWDGTNQIFGNGSGVVTGTSAGNTLLFRAYDVDGASYTTFATLTANNTPTMDLSTSVTRGGAAIVDISSSQTLTNKSINAANNTITNLDLNDFAASVVITAAEGIASNDNDTTFPTSAAVKAYADSVIGSTDAMVYKGVIDASTNPNYPAADAGHTYKISVAGKVGGASGPNVEVGDMIICTTDSTASGTHASVGSNWNILQVNLEGAVIGPGSSTDNHIVTFDGTSGKLVQGGGSTIANVLSRANHTGTQLLSTISDAGTIASQDANNVSITGGSITGITDLAVADGGTGISSYTAGDILLASGTTTLSKLAIGTDQQVLQSNGTTLAYANPKPYKVLTVTTDTSAASGVHYLTNDSTNVCILTLPGAPTTGDKIKVTAINSNGWRLDPSGSDVIEFLGMTSTATTGYIGSDTTNDYSTAEVTYIGSGKWVVTSAVGCIEIV